ncbi:hypothetical protein [Phenylobacterium sp.]|uniref:hypothetical protein n=1 Tax=Phenylobacterium sp. TaxID=1871053 RepID=UPI00356B3F9A
MSFAPETETLAKPEALLRVPVGLASPLWGLFAGAAVSGAAWWWMTRWARPANLKAMFGGAATFEAAVAPEPAVLAAPVAEAVEAAIESFPEPVLEAVAELTPEAVVEAVLDAAPGAEALIEPPAALEPVSGESAPISPVLEALAPEAAVPEVIEPNILAETPAEAIAAAAPVAPKLKKKVAEPKSA